MKYGVVRVWLPGEVRVFLQRLREKDGVPVSRFVRECVLMRLRNEEVVDDDCKRFLLEYELRRLQVEQRGLRETQNMILANFVYLRDYARELVKGDYKNSSYVQLRRSILSYAGAEKALPALERVFARRDQIGERLCEIVGALYPDLKYSALNVLKGEYVSEHERVSWSSMTRKNREGGERPV